jgi:hypothetical protein
MFLSLPRFVALLGALLALAAGAAQARPYEGGTFKGRFAYSADGNHNDPDDWAASPVALAIFAEMGLRERLVHFDYNSILTATDPAWEKIHAESVLGAARAYGYDPARFFDDRRDPAAAVASLVRAINVSTADDPLYLIIAGPVEVPLRALRACDQARLPHVFCVSHSSWNDGFHPTYKFAFTKRTVIEHGGHWVQIANQNRLLAFSRYGAPAKPEEFAPYFWMRDSADPKVRFLWERMVVSTRPDPSDAGMAWFLATGDEECTPEKLRDLLADGIRPRPVAARRHVRLEAENFARLTGAKVEFKNDRSTSHRLEVLTSGGAAELATRLVEPYVADGRYDVEVRFAPGSSAPARLALRLNGAPRGEAWVAAGPANAWQSHVLPDLALRLGDELTIAAEGGPVRLDYVQLSVHGAVASAPETRRPAFAVTGPLDDPAALPGGLIVAGANPGYLKYNGGAPVFLCGPDNPEDFLFRGTLNPDGTRSGGGQNEMIARLARAGVNAFHCLVFRMKRCNIKQEGDDTHCPFVDHDPAKPLNKAVLAQWDGWLAEFERAGINVHFELYNDATDVERLGWKLDANGELHPDERRFVAGIVARFKHRRNILWGIQESCNKLPRERTRHFKKIAELIARTDNHRHPIVQSFVVPGDPEGDFPPDGATTDDYAGDPHIRVITWLHVVPHGTDYDRQHREYLRFAQMDRHRFVAMKNETFRHPRHREQSRRYMWACAMTGLHTLEAYHDADPNREPARQRTSDDVLRDDGHLRRFMEQTDVHRLVSHDELAHGSAKWVLARPGESYIAHTYAYSGPMGLKALPAGRYDLLWFDPATGREEHARGVTVAGGDTAWPKPEGIGQEVALHVRRVNGAGR